MNIDKIKQVIKLQKEIRAENDNIINIDMILDEAKVLIRPDLFKELFADKKYTVKYENGKYFYKGQFDGITFSANNETNIFN